MDLAQVGGFHKQGAQGGSRSVLYFEPLATQEPPVRLLGLRKSPARPLDEIREKMIWYDQFDPIGQITL